MSAGDRIVYLEELLQDGATHTGDCEVCHAGPRGLYTDTDEPGDYQVCAECIERELRKLRKREGRNR